MFQRILVPLDGSPHAARIVPIAARLARHAGGEVILLQITNGGGAGSTQESVPWAPRHTEAVAYLNQVASRDEFADVRTQTIIREGATADAILAVAVSSAVDLIILSQRKSADEPARAPGGVVARVAREAPVTVLMVREQQSPLARVHPTQPCALRLLVPLDGSPLAEIALAPAAILLDALGGAQQSSLHLAQIIPSVTGWRHSARYLAQIAERVRAGALTGHALTVTWSVIPHADPAEALIYLAEVGEDPDTLRSWSVARDLGPEPGSGRADTAGSDAGFQHCDAIVMTTHGHSGFHHLLVGSVAERVLRKASTPLMLVRHAPGAAPPSSLIPEPDVDRWRL